MDGFAKTGSDSLRAPLSRASPRVISLAVTAVVHLLALILVLHSQFPVSADHTPRSPERIVVVSQAPENQGTATKEPPAVAPPRAEQAGPARLAPNPAPEIAVPIVTSAMTVEMTDAQAAPANLPPQGRDASEVAQDYRRELFDRLAAQRHYPEAARLRHYQGDGAVLFRIDRSGDLLDAAMERSTGRDVLDRAALMQVRRAAPFPQIPPELPDELAVAMPLRFLIVPPGQRVAAR